MFELVIAFWKLHDSILHQDIKYFYDKVTAKEFAKHIGNCDNVTHIYMNDGFTGELILEIEHGEIVWEA